MTNFQHEDTIRRKQLGRAGVNKEMHELSIKCQKVIQYAE